MMADGDVRIETADAELNGDLSTPADAIGLVLFAHGSGSSRHSPRNRKVAADLNEARLGTLLMDLLTPDEEQLDMRTAELRFDIGLLARRLIGALDWVRQWSEVPLGLFGASTGAAAALIAAAERPRDVATVVSRGGRGDLAGASLPRVQAPTLLIVGGTDGPVIEMNRNAAREMTAEVELEIVPGAGHLFEEPGTLDAVANLAAAWFVRYLTDRAKRSA